MNTEHQIKIKINMTCVSKKHEIKTKLVQEQCLQLKITFLFFYWVELAFDREEGRNLSKFLAGGGRRLPLSPSRENPIYIYIYIYIYKRSFPTGFYIQ